MQAPDPERGEQDPLEQLVFECLERAQIEGPAAIEALCTAHPDHATALRAEMARLQRAGMLALPAAEASAPFPERLGGFRLIECLGGGGMGVVYLALDEQLGRRVALKLVRPELLFFPGPAERFRREMQAVAKMQHPGIVPIYSVGEENGLPYFAMELIDGCTLAQVLDALCGRDPASLSGKDLSKAIAAASRDTPDAAHGPGDDAQFECSWVDACLRLARQVAEALEHAHSRAIVHRDVKPSNIAVTRTGRAILIDFGLASREGEDHLTKSGSQPGSLPYMSPEQIHGVRDVDPRTDVYSLGVTLYELLTLRRPFAGETSEETRRLILGAQPARIQSLNRAVAWDAQTVCATAMEHDPLRRYATPGDFARDLGNVLARRPIEARRPGAWLRMLRWSQRHPTSSVAASVAILLALGSALVFAVEQRAHASELKNERDEIQKIATEFLFDFHDSIKDLAGATPARELIVKRALGLLDRLSRDARADPRLRYDVAVAYAKLATVLGQPGASNMGDLERAAENFGRALSLLDELHAEDPSHTGTLVSLRTVLGGLGQVEVSQGAFAAAEAHLERAREVGQRLVDSDPSVAGHQSELANALSGKAHLVAMRGDNEGAAELRRQAIAIGERALEFAPENVGLRRVVADLQLALAERAVVTGDSEAALAFYRKSLDATAALVASHPDDAGLRSMLADTQWRFGDHLATRGELSAGLKLMLDSMGWPKHLVDADPTNVNARMHLLVAHLQVASLLRDRGERDASREHYVAAMELGESMIRTSTDLDVKAELGRAYAGVGEEHLARFELDDALEFLAKARLAYEGCLAVSPANQGLRQNLALVHYSLGEAKLKAQDAAGAVESYSTCVNMLRELADADPKDVSLHGNLARTIGSLGLAFLYTGDEDSARKAYDENLAMQEALNRSNPENAWFKLMLAKSHMMRAFFESAVAAPALAVEECKLAIEILEALTAAEPGNPRYSSDLEQVHALLAQAGQALAAEQAQNQR